MSETDVRVSLAVERAMSLPHLRRKYGQRRPVAEAYQLEGFPPMDKADLAACAEAVKERARAAGVGAYVFGSGGTTGTPKLSFISGDFFLDEIVAVWCPLGCGDVFLNTFAPGKLWSSHYFYNQLAVRLGAITVPVGSLDGPENEAWGAFAEDFGVTAIGGTDTGLRELLAALERSGRTLTGVTAVLWVGEPLRRQTIELVRRVTPRAGLWGLYGSTETWVIGFNTPQCPPWVFHVLPYQYVEIDDSRRLSVTNTHPSCINPLVRYRVGDLASRTVCDCGRPSAVRLHGRADDAVKFRGALLHADELVDLVCETGRVESAQIAIVACPDGQERLEIRCLGGASFDEEAVRTAVLARSLDLSNLFDDDPNGLRVVPVRRLETTKRSVKTPTLVRETEAA
jgi:phenylacetate-coenzyme A ligase PaaK-like adenylate-forming protein